MRAKKIENVSCLIRHICHDRLRLQWNKWMGAPKSHMRRDDDFSFLMLFLNFIIVHDESSKLASSHVTSWWELRHVTAWYSTSALPTELWQTGTRTRCIAGAWLSILLLPDPSELNSLPGVSARMPSIHPYILHQPLLSVIIDWKI